MNVMTSQKRCFRLEHQIGQLENTKCKMDVETNPDRSHGYDVDMTFILTSSQSAKSPKKTV